MLPPGRLIRAARILVGWSQDQLARNASVGRNSLGRLEAELADSRGSTIEKLMAALEKGGIRFIPATDADEMGIALRKRRAEATQGSVGKARDLAGRSGQGTESGKRSKDR